MFFNTKNRHIFFLNQVYVFELPQPIHFKSHWLYFIKEHNATRRRCRESKYETREVFEIIYVGGQEHSFRYNTM